MVASIGWRGLPFQAQVFLGAHPKIRYCMQLVVCATKFASLRKPFASRTSTMFGFRFQFFDSPGRTHDLQIVSSVAAATYFVYNYENPDGREHAFSGVSLYQSQSDGASQKLAL